jgi:hypothetical protein
MNDSMIESASQPLISWRSIIGGFLVSMVTMLGLLGLGMAMGGIGMDEETSGGSVGMFSGIWFVASTAISIFVGSYYSARVSSFRIARVGSAQGILIATLFLGFFLYQTIAGISAAGKAAGSVIGNTAQMVGAGSQKAANSPVISEMVEDRMNDLKLRSEPGVVASGVANRLMRGNAEGAKNYLASQAGIPPQEADRRIAEYRGELDRYTSDAKMAAGTALKATGWSLFIIVVMSVGASILGGMLGSRANSHKPIVRQGMPLRTQHT